MQQYVKECLVSIDFKCDSDHRILISEVLTQITKNARWKQQEKNIVPNPDPKALKEKEIKKSFLQAVANEMKKKTYLQTEIKSCLDSAADSTPHKLKGNQDQGNL